MTVYVTFTFTSFEEGLMIGVKELEFVGLLKEMDL